MSDNTPTNPPDVDVAEFAARHGIAVEEAQRLVDEIGYDTSELDAAAQTLKLDREG